MQRTNELHIPYPRFIECIRVNVLCRIAQKETTAIIYMKETTRFTHHLLFSSTKTRFVKNVTGTTLLFFICSTLFLMTLLQESVTRQRVCVWTQVSGHRWGWRVAGTWSPPETSAPMCSMWLVMGAAVKRTGYIKLAMSGIQSLNTNTGHNTVYVNNVNINITNTSADNNVILDSVSSVPPH